MIDTDAAEREADRLVSEFGPFETPQDMVAVADSLAESGKATGLERAALEILRRRAAGR